MSETCFAYESSRLVYEALRAEHAAVLFQALADPLVSRHLNCDPPASVEALSAQFARVAAGPSPHQSHLQWINFAVQVKADGQWIGRVEATAHPDWAEVAYLFGPAHWGRGYASESLEWLHSYLRIQHGVSEFWATVAPGNERSIRLLLRSGYRRTPMCDARPLSSFEPGDEVFQFIME